MKLLITGSSGQLGTQIRANLAQSHHEVIGVDLPEIDLTRRDLALSVICETEPDAILHCAAMTAVDACESQVEAAFNANWMATRWVVEGARRVDARVVYVSTDYVFDGTQQGAYREYDEPCPRSVYGASKLAGERALGPMDCVARTSWVVGEFGNNIVKTVRGLAERGQEMKFVTDQRGCPTFTADLADALVRLAVERAAGVFHVTNQGAVSWYEFVRAILRAGGYDEDLVKPIETHELDPPRPAPRPANSVLDGTLFASAFGAMRDFEGPLGEVMAALSQQ